MERNCTKLETAEVAVHAMLNYGFRHYFQRVVEEWLLLMPAIKRFTGKAPNEEKSE